MAFVTILQAFDSKGVAQWSGSSSVKDHSNWLELLSFSYAASQLGTRSAPASPGRPTVSFSFAGQDAATQVIFTDCTTGTTYDHVTLQVYKVEDTAKDWFLQREFRKAIISSTAISGGSSSSDTPTASASLDYADQVTVYRRSTNKDSDFGDDSTYDAASP